MSKILLSKYGVTLGRYAAPKGKVMFQLTVGREYIQLDTIEMEELLADLQRALHGENLSFMETAGQLPSLVALPGLVETDSKGAEGRFTFAIPEEG